VMAHAGGFGPGRRDRQLVFGQGGGISKARVEVWYAKETGPVKSLVAHPLDREGEEPAGKPLLPGGGVGVDAGDATHPQGRPAHPLVKGDDGQPGQGAALGANGQFGVGLAGDDPDGGLTVHVFDDILSLALVVKSGVGGFNAMLQKIAHTVRALTVDAVEAAQSGHPGLPLGMADVGALLYGKILRHDPSWPEWPDRDRVILSGGHGSMWLYSLLHLSGYDLPMEELKNFRQLGSATPGHPEYGDTPGVETTTGPLGQGMANAVGMALAERML